MILRQLLHSDPIATAVVRFWLRRKGRGRRVRPG